MATLIVQVPQGGRLERRLREDPRGAVLDPVRPVTPGRIDPPAAARAVFSTASPEGLVREREELAGALAAARTGTEPLAILVEGAEELREDELAAAQEATAHAKRDVILVLMRELEPA
jgi:hypothetical protein